MWRYLERHHYKLTSASFTDITALSGDNAFAVLAFLTLVAIFISNAVIFATAFQFPQGRSLEINYLAAVKFVGFMMIWEELDLWDRWYDEQPVTVKNDNLTYPLMQPQSVIEWVELVSLDCYFNLVVIVGNVSMLSTLSCLHFYEMSV